MGVGWVHRTRAFVCIEMLEIEMLEFKMLEIEMLETNYRLQITSLLFLVQDGNAPFHFGFGGFQEGHVIAHHRIVG